MTQKIGIVSQKGGVGRSTMARLIAREYAAAEYNVLIADMDTAQSTSFRWNQRRLNNGFTPTIDVQQFNSVRRVLRLEQSYEIIIFDGAPYSSGQTLDIAKNSDLVIIPSGSSLDDLEPAIMLGNELKENGISIDHISLVLNHTGHSDLETKEAFEFLSRLPYYVYSIDLPERTAYRRAVDSGKAPTETTHNTTNERAEKLAELVASRLEEITNPQNNKVK